MTDVSFGGKGRYDEEITVSATDDKHLAFGTSLMSLGDRWIPLQVCKTCLGDGRNLPNREQHIIVLGWLCFISELQLPRQSILDRLYSHSSSWVVSISWNKLVIGTHSAKSLAIPAPFPNSMVITTAVHFASEVPSDCWNEVSVWEDGVVKETDFHVWVPSRTKSCPAVTFWLWTAIKDVT